MKQILLIFSVVLMPFLAFNQTETLLLDSFYNYLDVTNEAFQRDYYQYDEKGRIVEEIMLVNSNTLQNQKRTFQYFDVENIEIERIYQQAQNSDPWSFECEVVKEHDYFGNVIQEEILNRPDYYIWGIGKWNKKTHQYDKNGRLIETIEDDNLKRFWTYDEQGNLLEQGFYYWDENLNTWGEPVFLLKKEYGENGKISYYKQSNLMRDMFNVEEYFYDSLNRVSETLFSVEYWGSTVTRPTQKLTSYYVGNTSKLDYKLYQSRGDSSWQTPNLQIFLSYDNFENIAEEIEQRLDINGVWQNYSRYAYSYNNDNLLTEFLRQSWHSYNQEWIDGQIKTYTYYPDKVLKREITTKDGITSEKIYYRSEKSILSANEDIATCLFPNPYVNQQHIYCEALEAEKEYNFMAFNLLGQTVYQTNFIGRDGFKIEKHLEKGWYVFVVSDGGKILQKQKILIF